MPNRPRPLVIGHRGASGYRPEHTSSAYELAVALGADALEPDIVATRDGVLVLRHENEISGTTDVASRPEFADRRVRKEIDGSPVTGWFTEDFTWAELSTLRARERLPAIRPASASFDGQYPMLRMQDLFEILDRSATDARATGLVAEIKHASYFDSIGLPLDELFADSLSTAGWAPADERLTIESFETTVLAKLRNRGVGRKRVFLIESAGAPFDLVAASGSQAMSYAEFASADGLRSLAGAVDGVSVDKNMLFDTAAGVAPSSRLVDDAHAAGLEIYCWTLRPENRFLRRGNRAGSEPSAYGDWLSEYRAIMGTGIDGVFADHPDLAVRARAARS